MTKIFSVYRSSAGSGKTRTLAKAYLRLALQYRADYFKHILAVTFTNKASQEMKDRILQYLDDFAQGRKVELAEELQKELSMDAQTFRQHSQETQSTLLHQYDNFSISTIDAFFQKVIRSFTREAGLVGDYRLEVDQDAVLEEVIDNLIDELGENKELTDWVVDFAKENLENERSWDVRYSLIDFAKEIFREEFKDLEDEVNSTTSQKNFFKDLRRRLRELKSSFITEISKPAREAVEIIRAKGWDAGDFSYGKNSGLLSFMSQFVRGKNLSGYKAPSDRVRNYFADAANWPNKKSSHAREILHTATDELVPRLLAIIEVFDKKYRPAFSAEVALKNMYVFGLIADISRKLKEYKDENNLMLLADAPKFLNGVIRDSDTPFIYEKVGSFYRNYLIDEFQDTSGLQWQNFQPLIANSLDQGYPSLVVGDVKQAIYRWRGGDLSLLQDKIVKLIGKERVDVQELDNNFRSAGEIVDFNNAIFKTASQILSIESGMAVSTHAYEDVAQKISRKDRGFVEIQFLTEE
ncbi:MAG TPA: UvrD-helicase domain-containing protein, partial [Chryseosolibacter sp.]